MRNAAILSLLFLGCSAESARESAHIASTATSLDEGMTREVAAVAQAHRAATQVDRNDAAVPGVGALQRKIIYTADIELVVENFSDVPARLDELVRQNEGYVASSNLGGSAGDRRSGTWKVRVPALRFDVFVNAARTLGEVRRVGTNSQDVSEEFYDVEARIRNRKREEEQFLKLLADRTGKLDDVLAIEKELSRVREEVERFEGRLRVLQDLTAMTTVSLTIEEVKNYVPTEAATLNASAGRSPDRSNPCKTPAKHC
jgi:hypothetical protein